MKLSEHFDPYNPSHLKAFRHLEANGSWPEWFFDELPFDLELNIAFDTIEVTSKMANAWLEYMEKTSKLALDDWRTFDQS